MNKGNSAYLTDDESIRTRTALFNKYVYPYRNLIYHLCIKNTRDHHNIADNYNEVLINFFRYVSSYDPRREVKTWIYAVTVRMLADLERKNNRFTREGSLGAMNMEQLADESRQPDVTLENYRDLLGDEVLEALEKVGRIYREPLLLQVAGYKLDEIMEILYQRGNLKTRNLETTKSRIFLAKKKLKEMLTRDGKRKEDQ
ncbi:RNA polymerase sigma factor [Bacteroides sp.]|uniref:RNA polymerase sigma factor n=1 Tax=Bacteroides sp. TaxID=29523 RepID=UPI003A8F966F